jgi:hypothetical protein
VSMAERGLPFEMREAVVHVCGRTFWLKDPLRSFLLGAGVPTPLYDRYAEESKYRIARHILGELAGMGEAGWAVQRRIVTELCRLRTAPDETVPDRDGATRALRYLKELATAQGLLVEEQRSQTEQRALEVRYRQAALAAKAQKMEQLRTAFAALNGGRSDPQQRGYGLEDLVAELFGLHEIPYRRAYRTVTEQIDGRFTFLGADYLVETRPREAPPTEVDIGAFKNKVDTTLTGARGLLVSVATFPPEVVFEFTRGAASNILLLDGPDLGLILDGHVSLPDALDRKIQKAVQEGILYFPLSQRFSA